MTVASPKTFASLSRSIRRLYEGPTPSGVGFRYALLAFDMVTVLFIIATSFLPSSEIIETLDVLFGSRYLPISQHDCSSAGIGCAISPASQRGLT
jgi:hypothetical protein